jgi:hypothetical protein
MLMLSTLAIFNGVLHAKLSKAPHYEITISVNSVFSQYTVYVMHRTMYFFLTLFQPFSLSTSKEVGGRGD